MSHESELILNDPGTLVSETPDSNLLPLATEKHTANFELGVSMIIHSWYTLTTAVDNSWGGPQSSEKRDWITGIIIEEFENNKEIDIIYIHELLCGAMEDEFDTIIEDESTVDVATKIVKCFKDCKLGDFSNVQNMYTKWLNKQKNKSKIVANIINDPLNPDVSDNDDDDDEEDEDVDMDVDNNYEISQIQEQPKQTKNEPIVDDDGFTLVQNKKGRR